MNLRPEELEANGYHLLDKLGHQELVPFIRTYLKKPTLFSRAYYLCNFLLFGLIGYYFMVDFSSPSYDIGVRFTHFSYGIALAFLLLPLHEYIHVLAYKSQGASNTSYDANLKKFYFMALADKFVANRKEFRVVALAPFVAITTGLVLLALVVPPQWTLTVLATLLAHTAMCSGDFGLLSYFDFHRGKQLVTYDDIEHHISYFYGKESA
ncbi:MAG: DUF3267 domain-containing protein [Spirosomataceae bacterium]